MRREGLGHLACPKTTSVLPQNLQLQFLPHIVEVDFHTAEWKRTWRFMDDGLKRHIELIAVCDHRAVRPLAF